MKNKAWLEYTATDEDVGRTVEQILKETLNISGRMIQRLTRSKGIQLNRKAPFLKREVKVGDRISVRITDQKPPGAIPPVHAGAIEAPVPILFEDQLFLVVNKPAGMPVHPTNPSQTGTLVQQLAAYLEAQGATPHAVHRLDKETTGTVLIAKSSYAHQLADKLLRANELHREYLAIVTGEVSEAKGAKETINQPIARDPNHSTRRRVHPNGDAAITHYEVMESHESGSLVQVELETGRTHQIRVHFAWLGHPLLGDTLYGGKKSGFYRAALHASKLAFTHPVTQESISVEATLPNDFQSYFQNHFQQQLSATAKGDFL
ncbi:RluA family pseudouridine synthase [Brevibacillus ginsengisoli]|uniref:RluA family pseudouridine synthase n=1 Tax=Brevibacillus ginsengisoli TaxID=363854 RepID=UPI003CF0F417